MRIEVNNYPDAVKVAELVKGNISSNGITTGLNEEEIKAALQDCNISYVIERNREREEQIIDAISQCKNQSCSQSLPQNQSMSLINKEFLFMGQHCKVISKEGEDKTGAYYKITKDGEEDYMYEHSIEYLLTYNSPPKEYFKQNPISDQVIDQIIDELIKVNETL